MTGRFDFLVCPLLEGMDYKVSINIHTSGGQISGVQRINGDIDVYFRPVDFFRVEAFMKLDSFPARILGHPFKLIAAKSKFVYTIDTRGAHVTLAFEAVTGDEGPFMNKET